jgi:hypothetical protein
MSDNSRVRVSIVGVVIVALFSTLLVRLWFLQSGPEDSLKAQAVVDSQRSDPDAGAARRDQGSERRRAGATRRGRSPSTVTSQRAAARVIGQLAELLHVKVSSPVAIRAIDNRRSSPRSSRSTCRNRIGSGDPPGSVELSRVHVKALTVREYPMGDQAAAARLRRGGTEDEEAPVSSSVIYEPGDQIGLMRAEAARIGATLRTPRPRSSRSNPTAVVWGAGEDGNGGW